MDNRLPLVGMESLVSIIVEKQRFATQKEVLFIATTVRIMDSTG
jgi:hypothetical protein